MVEHPDEQEQAVAESLARADVAIRKQNAQGDKELIQRLASVESRLDILDQGRPKNSLRIKNTDGHHHMEPLRMLEEGTDRGFGFEVNVVGGTVTRGTLANNRLFTLTTGGGVGFCFDYLIESLYTGTEGATTTLPNSTFTFKVYSEPLAAQAHALANRTTAFQGTTFFVCGEHTLTGTLEMATGGNGQTHRWVGTSAGSSKLITDGTNKVVNVNGESAGSGVDPIFYVDKLWLDALAVNTNCMNIEGGAAVKLYECVLEIGDSSATAVVIQGLDINIVDIDKCKFQGATGTALHFDGTAGNANITRNLFQTMPTCIVIDNSTRFTIHDNTFQTFTTYAITIDGNASETNAVISDNRFVFGSSAIGIGFLSGANSNSSMVIHGNAFSGIGGGSKGIDFTTMNSSGLVFALSINDNVFSIEGQSSTAFAIDGPTGDFVRGSIISGNVFRDIASGNEYRNWSNGTGNEAYHNISMDDDASVTQQALDDVGTPIGHVLGGDAHDHDGGDGATIDQIVDNDGDTKVQVEESSDDDTIRMDAGGSTDLFKLVSTKLDLAVDTFLANATGLVIGHTAQLSLVAQTVPELQILGTGTPDSTMVLGRFGNNGSEPSLRFFKSRAAAIGEPPGTIVDNNDKVGTIKWYADDGVDYDTPVATIEVRVDDVSPAAGDIGAEFNFLLQPGGGAGALQTVMVIAPDGELKLPLATASGQGLLLGGDTEIFRSAAGSLNVEGHLLIDDGTTLTHRWATGDEQSFNTSTNTYKITIATVDGIIATPTSVRIAAVPVTIDRGLILSDEDRTFTNNDEVLILTDSTLTLQDASGWSVQVYKFAATLIYSQNGDPFGAGVLFNSQPTFINATGGNLSMGPVFGFVAQSTVTADTETITQGLQIDFFSSPTWNIANSGTLNVTTWQNFSARGNTIGTGVTITTRQGYHMKDVSTLGGTLTNQYGLYVEHLTKAATVNAGIYNESRVIEPPQAAQSISNLTTAILHAARTVEIDPQSDLGTMTVNPQLSDGQDGEVVTIFSVSTNSLTLADGLGVRLNGTFTWTNIGDNITLKYLASAADWIEVSRTNV